MWSLARGLCPLVALALTGCSAAQSTSTDLAASASTSSSSTAGAVASSSAAPATSASPQDPAAASGSVPAAASPALVKAEAPPAHSVSSATGAPAASTSAVPGAAPTPDELEVIAMCTGKKSMFTAKEEKLLKLADASSDPAMHATADAIRARRRDSLKEACDRLHAAGKL